MHSDTKEILHAWAHGDGGVSQRLSKRAWLVLQDAARVHPVHISQAWGRAVRVQTWLTAFHAMGLPGLMDAPRSGRPSELVFEMDRIHTAMRNSSAGLDYAAIRALRQQPRNLREAIWRANRLNGSTLERRHRKLDVPLPVPDGLNGLHGLLLLPGFLLMATRTKGQPAVSEGFGTWLSVPWQSSILAGRDGMPHNLLSALQYNRQQHAPGFRADRHLMERFLYSLQGYTARFPGVLRLDAVCDMKRASHLLHFLAWCRQFGGWPTRSTSCPGFLQDLHVASSEPMLAIAVQKLLARALEQACAARLAQLLDELRQTSNGSLAWVVL